MTTVYHGSSVIVKEPDIGHSYRALDFGKGFYVTTNRGQAEQWAKRLYHKGIWDKERALREIRIYPSYDQLAFITQKAIDRLLTFQTFKEVL